MVLQPDFQHSDLSIIVPAISNNFDLSPELVACIILQESSGDAWLPRYEEAFYKKYVMNVSRANMLGYVPRRISFVTEKLMRAMSWGLMQVMGQTARELGFGGESLSRLSVPQIGITYGCNYLLQCFRNRTTSEALLKYNGGGNPNYDNEVMARLDNKEYDKILRKEPL